ncbi:MAG TPA: hypothetical protein VMU29_04675 [Smithella sp.]|nr:hypothetical protein [Smithella sp.]
MTDKFQRDYEKIWNNICGDPFLEENESLKEELFDVIKSNYNDSTIAKKGKEEAIEAITAFCVNNLLRGTVVSLLKGEYLGRVHSRQALRFQMGKILKNVYPDYADEMLEDLLSGGYVIGALQWFIDAFRSEKLSDNNMWSFRNPNNRYDPFSGYDVRTMPCLLGLKAKMQKYICLSYQLNEIQPHSPTFFDANFYDAWEPGGITVAVKNCNLQTDPKQDYEFYNCKTGIDCGLTDGAQGIPEVVHEPIPFGNIKTSIKEIGL